MKIYRKTNIVNDDYTQYIYDNLDIQNSSSTEFSINFDISIIDTDWNVGLIYGPSGSGKSLILNELGGETSCEFDNNKSLISNFNTVSPKEASFYLGKVGLNTVPSWLKPHAVLSNGEKYRAELALILSNAKPNELIIIDEFTSVVDRDVAKSMSYSLQKLIREKNLKVVFAACHYDILEWLLPDWSFSTLEGVVQKHDCLRQRPNIELRVFRANYEAWKYFKDHHYLTDGMNKSAAIFCFTWEGKPVALCGLLPSLGAGVRQTALTISRIVILPDYQGLGIGTKILEYVSSLYKYENRRMYIRTVHPGLGAYFTKSDNWLPTSSNLKEVKAGDTFEFNRKERAAYSFYYNGVGIEHDGKLTHKVQYYRSAKQIYEDPW